MAEEMAKVAKDIQAPTGVARLSAAKSPQVAKLLRRSSASTVSPNVAGDLEVMEEDDEDLPDPKAAFRAANDAHQAVQKKKTPQRDVDGGCGGDDSDQEEEQEPTPKRQYHSVDSENPFVLDFLACFPRTIARASLPLQSLSPLQHTSCTEPSSGMTSERRLRMRSR